MTAKHHLGQLSVFVVVRLVLPGLLFWLIAFFFNRFGPRILVADILTIAFYYFTFGLGVMLCSRVGRRPRNAVRDNFFAVTGVFLATVVFGLAAGYGLAGPALVFGVALNTFVAAVVVIASAFVGSWISRDV